MDDERRWPRTRARETTGAECEANVHCPVPVKNKRRVLCVFPGYTPSFGTFQHAYKLMYRVKAFMPPQGLLLIAAYMPESWPVRFVDENIKPATEADFAWADVVLVTGMHIQGDQIRNIQARAKVAGKVTVLGGPSVSASPEMYPGFDYLHVGELGDATDAIIRAIDESTAPPAQQMVFKTKDRLPLTEFPIPAYDKVPFGRYLLGTVQFSSGCPYLCEFCDIPGLYGRQPRMKTPQQIVAELDCIFSQPNPPATLYFVDDNFIGNRKAAKEMLPHLVEWQKKHSYPVMFACEATLNIAKQTDILELMKEANFVGMFVGIETPEADALNAIRKGHNNAVPMMESIKTLNSYGIEITSGIILGLDSETADTEQRLKDFIDLSQIPMLTINLLQALPKTPLWDRLARDGRLREDDSHESNVVFLRPHDEVVATWRRSIAYANDPDKLFERFRYQVDATYVNRKVTPAKGKLTWNNLRGGAVMAWRILLHLGLLSDFRKSFWRMTKYALRKGQIDGMMGAAFMGYHLIEFTREALRGDQNASYYSTKKRTAPMAVAKPPARRDEQVAA
ncbi:MAG: hopanoid methylase [Hyphomicrobiales bacterium]|nr:hopanoid methylase [Hyphomicrobiales bacterium]